MEEYLTTFGGTVIIVSHDRFFVDKVADHLFVLDGKGGVKDFPGNYSEYLIWSRENERQQREAEAAAKAEASKSAPSTPAATPQAKTSRPAKLTYAQKKELEKIDAELPKLNTRKAEIEALLGGGETDPQKIMDLSDEYGKVKDQIDEMEMRWLELQEIIGG